MWWKGNTCTLLVEMLVGPTTMENNMQTPQKKKKKTEREIYHMIRQCHKENKNRILKLYISTPMFVALFTIVKVWNQPKCPPTPLDEG